MQRIIDGLIGKRMGAVLFDGKVLEGGSEGLNVVPHENTKPYVVSKDEEQSKALFEKDYKVIFGEKSSLHVSTNWSPFVVCAPKDYSEFIYLSSMLSEIDGVIIYSYENLFKIGDMDAMRKHHEVCATVVGLRHRQHLQEDGKQYLVATKTSKLLSSRDGFDDFLIHLMGPIIDVSVTRVVLKSKPHWKHPNFFEESEMPNWKREVYFSKATVRDKLFGDMGKPRFLGGAIEIPNHEQVTVLIASGAINDEIILDDGRIVTLKGTEIVSTRDRIKYDLEQNPVALIEQQIRETLVYGLDMTNGEFFKLHSGS